MSSGSEPPLQECSDEQLVSAYRQDREDAFALLVDRYRQELFHFLMRFVGRRHPAEELFQEVFFQVHRSIDKFDVTRRFKPWLFTIAANKARDHLRRTSRRQAIPLSALAGDDQDRSVIDLLSADVPQPDEVAIRVELQEVIRQVVKSLPDHLREVLLLAYFQQLAYKEIAEVLSIPLGTVKSRLHTAVGTFAQRWKEQEAGPSPQEAPRTRQTQE